MGLLLAVAPAGLRAATFPGAETELPAALEGPAGESPEAEIGRLGGLLARAPLSARSQALLNLRLGLLAFERGDWALALDAFTAAEGASVADLVLFHRAEASFHLGRYADAAALYQALPLKHPGSDWRHRARFRLGDCLAAQGRPAPAIAAWRAALADYPEYPGRAPLRFAMARQEAALGHLDRAAALYREIRKLDPGDPLALVAAREVAALETRGVKALHPSPEERLAQALDLRRRKYYAEAIAALEGMRAEPDVTGKVRDDVEWNIARSLWESERFEPSLEAFRKIHDTTKDPGRRRRSLRWIGYALERLGKLDDAAKALAEASGRPSAPPAEVAEDIAWLYFNSAEYKQAEAWFKRLPAKTPGLRWMNAWLAFKRSDFKKAAAAFGALAGKAKVARERFRYWEARARAAAGEKARALELYREVRATSTIGYYGYQAAARLLEAGEGAAEPPAKGTPAAPDAPVGEDPLPVLQLLAQRWGGLFPALLEALDLTAVGETRLAAGKLRAVSDELRAFRTNRPSRKALSRWSFRPRPYLDNREKPRHTGEWGRKLDEPPLPADPRRGPALAAGLPGEFMPLLTRAFAAVDDAHYARRHGGGAGKLPSPPEAPEHREAWARRFPRAFAGVLTPKARQYGIDPWLLWAFMTVESSYNPLAISRANARGLMQVMPQTGGLIADRMALRGFSHALLFEPEIALEMAAWYVHALLEKFNGQSPLAIAAYNAGPHRVAAWLRRKGGLPMDEFIEEIPYDEAREYTKKVIRFWGLYRRIYQGRAGLDLTQRVDPHFKDNINF